MVMKRYVSIFLAALLTASGFTSALGDAPDGEARKVFLVYSADERSELAPCG